MDMDRYIGRLLDNRYEILEVIGTGGQAVVYKARCHRLNRLVAIKILKDENLQDEDFRRRFHAEGQAVGMLSHPNIVSVYDVSSSDEADYIVMELVDGISLKQYMEKKGVLNWKETLHFAIQIAKALEHAHSRGIVHRDIKPHNVMVLKNGSVRVTDFGIARVMSKSNTLTKEALGSVHYISPEQAKGGRVDNRSDLYSLGVVMYEMITGRPPFDGESPVSVAIQHIAGGATKPSVLNPNMPEGLEQIIMKAMAHDVKERYASATQMLADLDELRKDPTAVFPLVKPAASVAVDRPKAENGDESVAKAAKTAAAQKAVRKKKPKSREDMELSRDRVATIAIIVCAVVAMVAIIIFLGMLISDGALQPAEKTVNVPSMVGIHYERLPDYDGVVVIQQGTAYSEEYDEGVIIHQQPEAGTPVAEGTKVFVLISLGKAPESITLRDMTGWTQTEAELYLNGLDLKLKITVEEAYSTAPKGQVVSFSPAKDTELYSGQTVKLVISKGQETVTATMPDLILGAANTKETAEAVLNGRGFYNIDWVPVESAQPEGRIVSQSTAAGMVIDVTTKIVIEYSNGVAPVKLAEMPNLLTMDKDAAAVVMELLGFTNVDIVEVDGSEPVGTVIRQSATAGDMVDINGYIRVEYSNGLLVEPVTISYTFNLKNSSESYLLTILYGDEILVMDQQISAGQTTYTMELTGKSVQKYALYINGAYYKTVAVDFGTDEQ